MLGLNISHASRSPAVLHSPHVATIDLVFASFVPAERVLIAWQQVGSRTIAMSSETAPIGPADVDEKITIEEHIATSPIPSTDFSKLPWFKRWNARIEGLAGFEARGLARVHESERQPASNMSLLQMLLLWFSANLTINNLAVTLTGPLLFGLGFVDCVLCAIFGVALGALSTAYMATWGAVSGNRTMVCLGSPLPNYYPANCLSRS